MQETHPVNVCNTWHWLHPSIFKSLEPPKQRSGRGGRKMTPKKTTMKKSREALGLSSLWYSWQNVCWSTAEDFIDRGDTEEIQTNQWIPAVRDKQFQMLHTTRITLQPDSLPRRRLGKLLSDYFQLQCFMKTLGILYALMRKTSVYIGSSSSSRKHWGKY